MQAKLFPVTPVRGSRRAALAVAAMVVLSTIFTSLPVRAQAGPEMAAPRRLPVVHSAAPYQSRATRARLASMQADVGELGPRGRTAPGAEVVETPQPMEPKAHLLQPESAEDLPAPEGMVPFQEDGGEFDSCGPECGDGCDSCGDGPCVGFIWPRGRIGFRGEYLTWWTKSATLPPLATTGALGVGGTDILFGGESVDLSTRSGGRFTIDYWMCGCQDTGFEVVAMFLGDKSADFSRSSQGDPILARPFFNVETAAEDAGLIASPGTQTGALSIQTGNELDSFEFLFRRAAMRRPGHQLDVLVGYRYGRFAENLTINETSTFIDELGPAPVGTVTRISDQFATENLFNGAELGILSHREGYRWSFDLLAKLALGGTQSKVNINGSTVTSVPGVSPVTTVGGLLAQPTNIGSFEQSDFTVIPELGATIGYDLTCRLRATLGYTFLYWSRVARPGDMVDLNVNPSQFGGGALAGVPAPAFRFVTTDFWAQGLNFGLDFRF